MISSDKFLTENKYFLRQRRVRRYEKFYSHYPSTDVVLDSGIGRGNGVCCSLFVRNVIRFTPCSFLSQIRSLNMLKINNTSGFENLDFF